MKYALLIYQGNTPLPGSAAWKDMSAAEQQGIYADYKAFNEIPGVEQGLPLGLPGKAKTVRVREGKPDIRPETYMAEGVAGYCVVEVEDEEAALSIASRIPAARLGGAVEVRPIETYW
ncbi:MAG: hypothetical protein K0Q91_1733 [Fibrobacteria bacterium]|jgi:hypothetical protein|nr:hypothetical protein [Fibrobacteria bacterium]